MIENIQKRIAEYSHCFSHSKEDINLHETNSSLGSPNSEVSLYDDFEPSYQSRFNLQDDEPFPSLEQENRLPTSPSPDIAPHTSSSKDITEGVLVFVTPPTPLNHSCEFDKGEDPSELDMNIKFDIKHHEIDESEETILEETCVEVIKPTKLKFNDVILSMKYESFSCGFDINDSFDEGFCVEYECFSFDSIITDLLFEYHKAKFIESENIATKNFDLSETLTPFDIRRLMDFRPTILPRLLMPVDNHIFGPMNTLLANTEYICLIPN